jgi:hypothetical protein
MASVRLQTAERFISHFATMDEGILETVLADDYTHQYAPGSIPNQGPFDKNGLINFVNGFKRIIKTYPMTIMESIDRAATLLLFGRQGKLQFTMS